MRWWGRTRLRVLAATTVVMATTTVIAAPGASGDAFEPTGKSAADAAASCWEIKQNDSGAKDGTYWLQTPELVAPEQFYCDMTTNGGGWVLVGRGREGWRPQYIGLGKTADVRTNVSGPEAFRPKQLHSKVIDGLLNGTDVKELDDGVRLKRAADQQGQTWQESRLHMAKRDRWTWAFGAEHPVESWKIGKESGNADKLPSVGTGGGRYRINAHSIEEQGWNYGFAYGGSSRGSSDAGSYIYSRSAFAGYPHPFTQVFLRPKLTQEDLNYSDVSDGGTDSDEVKPLLQSGVQKQEWGVTGRKTDRDDEHHTEAQTFEQSGDTVFVGGNFANVSQGEDGESIDQSYLAGFDVNSGEPVRDFTPTFNGQVKTLKVLPDGKLVAGGEFTEVNGEQHVGLVALDPKTGEVDDDFDVQAADSRDDDVRVWDLQVHDDQLYVAGKLTHLRGKGQDENVPTRLAGRISLDDGKVDEDWNPRMNGTPYDIDISEDGKRFYATGHIASAGGEDAEKVAVLSTEKGAKPIPGMKDPQFSDPSTNTWQHTIDEIGDRVWVGGSQHALFSYDPEDFSIKSGNISRIGGDFQDIGNFDGNVYGQCHCGEWLYSEAYTWKNIGNDWTQGDDMRYVGAWDEKTGQYEPEFSPWINTSHGQGGWGSFRDSTGKAWFGGDFKSGRTNNHSTWTWLGGFARFAPRDHEAPSEPKSLKDNGGTLSWDASSDDTKVTAYEVLRDDRVIGTTTSTSFKTDGPGRYFVRAVDAEDNRSTSTEVYEID